MKEKRYTLPEEQKDAAFVAESAPAYHGNAAMALPEDECAEEEDSLYFGNASAFRIFGLEMHRNLRVFGLEMCRNNGYFGLEMLISC